MNNYYEKNKEKIKERQLYYYHKHKNNPDSSHYLPHRLKLQRDKYKEKFPLSKSYNTKNNKNIDIKFNYGYYIISFL